MFLIFANEPSCIMISVPQVNREIKFAGSDFSARIEERRDVTLSCSTAFFFYMEFVFSSGQHLYNVFLTGFLWCSFSVG